MQKPFAPILGALLLIGGPAFALTYNTKVQKYQTLPGNRPADAQFAPGVECFGPYTASPTTITSTVIVPSTTLGDTVSPVRVLFYANTQAIQYDYQSNTTTGQGKGIPVAVSTTVESQWLAPGTPLRVQSQTGTATLYYWLLRLK